MVMSKMEMIKDRMDFMLMRGTLTVNNDLDEKMLEIERQKAEIEHRKLQIQDFPECAHPVAKSQHYE